MLQRAADSTGMDEFCYMHITVGIIQSTIKYTRWFSGLGRGISAVEYDVREGVHHTTLTTGCISSKWQTQEGSMGIEIARLRDWLPVVVL